MGLGEAWGQEVRGNGRLEGGAARLDFLISWGDSRVMNVAVVWGSKGGCDRKPEGQLEATTVRFQGEGTA